jgi:hypothetical protein
MAPGRSLALIEWGNPSPWSNIRRIRSNAPYMWDVGTILPGVPPEGMKCARDATSRRCAVEVWYGLPNPQRFEDWNKWLPTRDSNS